MTMDKVFEALKLSPREIKFFKHVVKHNQSSSLDIQKGTELQQPEVSMAAKDLLRKKYILSELIDTDMKNGGRQAMVYSLAKDAYKLMADQLKAMVADQLNRADSYTSLVEELEGMKNKKSE